uniref:Maintenance of Photosystem II under High light 2 C-terminal domain-containing protein n=1 Tax=Lotharella globosa TaxID=91324 RepID=A0A6V3SAZ5_9EUKA|mmetsp:Transcript_12719/g.25966  ORF Transcript_12719/g.25966 Transcript_12719/m.25966 type:complete len:241 (-) Transcript_12719:235-957(-)|eukprot:CAMPEP_0167772426 /NCGR_PEP_ID=MMETSP0111_2-20121227/840_1 /TAXON_ID=91324 /ORGANISM="Lotharella globosa, Strain CCCM811" /LENGTH=240 /DNA_ID=CAMNT_0007661915 /DNA_START=54 /DNA_END=776 /DNA_ORIENTATION=+
MSGALTASLTTNAALLVALIFALSYNHHSSLGSPASRMAAAPSRMVSRTSTRAQKQGDMPQVSRRAIANGIACAAPLLGVRQAMALLPDDDDAELVARAKANRQKRIQEEKKTEYEFLASEGVTNKKQRIELQPITKAISRLADLGQQINENNMVAVSVSLTTPGSNGGWIEPLMTKVNELSDTDAKKASATALKQTLDSLSAAAESKDVSGLKRSYITTVTALEKWAVDANVATFLRQQ